MGQDSLHLATIITDAVITPELVRPLVSALETVQDNVVVETRSISGKGRRAWLLPTHVTVAFTPSGPTFQLLEDLASRNAWAVTAALVGVYTDVESRWDLASAARRAWPLGVEFHAQPHERFRFVLGFGLRPDDVVHALAGLPAALQKATARLRATKDLFGEPDSEALQSLGGRPYFELVHLYEDSVRGWEMIA